MKRNCLVREFNPQTLEDIKVGKAYLKLEKEVNKTLEKLKKKHKKVNDCDYMYELCQHTESASCSIVLNLGLSVSKLVAPHV